MNNDIVDGGICYLLLSDGGRETIIQLRPQLELRESEIASEARRVFFNAKHFHSQFIAMCVLEALPEVQ